MPGLWGRAGGRVLDGTLEVAARKGKGTTVGGGTTATGIVQGLLSADNGVSEVPGKGMKGGGNE